MDARIACVTSREPNGEFGVDWMADPGLSILNLAVEFIHGLIEPRTHERECGVSRTIQDPGKLRHLIAREILQDVRSWIHATRRTADAYTQARKILSTETFDRGCHPSLPPGTATRS